MTLIRGVENISSLFRNPPQRVVSLIPSITESLFDLGAGEMVVGVTDYCIHPDDKLVEIHRVGGTKSPRLKDILNLQPDLVIANQEENPRQLVEDLCNAGITVWLIFPKTVHGTLQILWAIVQIFRLEEGNCKMRLLEDAVRFAELALPDGRATSYFCPIWQGDLGEQTWWMTFNGDTYPSDLLGTMGGRNIFQERQRSYPLEADLGLAEPESPEGRDTRYPRVIGDEIIACQPEVILLPTEPYQFGLENINQFKEWFSNTPAIRMNQIFIIDGSLLTWHGTRMGKAIGELGGLLS